MRFTELSVCFAFDLRNLAMKPSVWRPICWMANRARSEKLNSCAVAEGAIQENGSEGLARFAEAGRWCGPETILLVEDEAFVRKATAEVLESAGYRLVIARTAAEALEACRRCLRPVDLLLTDIVMPGMSGRDLAAEFTSLCPRARVLLMSGDAELAACEGSRYGKKYLTKPFSVRVLLSRVREALNTIRSS